MVQLDKSFKIRQAEITDEYELKQLIQRKAFVHRHLDWYSPLSWLGRQPFYLLESEEQGLLAALAFPRDEDGIVWLRLFAVAPGFSTSLAWNKLWGTGLEWCQEYSPGSPITSLAIHPEMEKLLFSAGFKEINQVKSLVWDVTTARWPEVNRKLGLHKLEPDDLNRCYQIDRAAFKPIWRNTISQLQAAYQEAFYASVIKIDGVVRGYQISTTNPQGGHLARLAVDSAFQHQGLGSRLLGDMLDRFLEAGILDISVNTQADNIFSLNLYHKFGFIDLPEIYPVYQYQSNS
jgi:ribosomal protein S18 acetylase RimI-like enzyme